MEWNFGRVEVSARVKQEPPRKTRSDKRVRSTLRIEARLDELIKAIAYNHSSSKQKVTDKIIKMVLDSDSLRDKLIASFPKGSQKHAYLIMRD